MVELGIHAYFRNMSFGIRVRFSDESQTWIAQRKSDGNQCQIDASITIERFVELETPSICRFDETVDMIVSKTIVQKT